MELLASTSGTPTSSAFTGSPFASANRSRLPSSLLRCLRYCDQMWNLNLKLIKFLLIGMDRHFCLPARMLYVLCIYAGVLLPKTIPQFAGLLMLVHKYMPMAAVSYACCKFCGTLTVTLTWEFFLPIQFSEFLICLQIFCNQSKSIICSLPNQEDTGMPHQFALLIFHLVVIICGTGLASLFCSVTVHFTSYAQLFLLEVSTNGSL